MHGDIVETKLAVGIHRDGNLLDGAGAVIAAGLEEANFRRICLAGLDKEVVRDAQSLALFVGGHVILPILIDVHCALVHIAVAVPQLDLLIVKDEAAAAHRSIHEDFQVGVGAFHGAQIATVFFDLVLQPRPGGKAVGHANLLYRGQINHLQIEMSR